MKGDFFSSLVTTKQMYGEKKVAHKGSHTQIDSEKLRLDNSFYRWGEKV